MALIKNKDMKNMNKEDLISKKNELSKELMKIRTQISTGTMPENPGKTRLIKRTIARINTSLKSKTNTQKDSKKKMEVKNKA